MENKTFKFPNGGYDIVVVEKEDILNTIEQNITDREIMDEIISQLELDASKYIKEQRWTGIPFLGSIRIPPGKLLQRKRKEEIHEAYTTLPRKEYYIFMNKLHKDNDEIVRHNRLARYITSMSIRKNIQLYRKLSKEKGEIYAKLYLYFRALVKAVDNEMIINDINED